MLLRRQNIQTAAENNNNKSLQGVWSKARKKLLSSLPFCPFLNLAQSADQHEYDVFMAPVIIGGDNCMTRRDSILYKNKLMRV